MKVTAIVGAALTAATAANAFPWMAELVKDGVIDANGNVNRGFLDDLLNGNGLDTGLNNLKKQFGLPKFNAAQIGALNQQMQEAFQYMGVNSPEGKLMNTPRDQLSDSAIYSAYGLDRVKNFVEGSGNTVWNNGEFSWEDDIAADMANYRPFPPRYSAGYPLAKGANVAPSSNPNLTRRGDPEDWKSFSLPDVLKDYDNNLGWGPAENEKHPWFPPTYGQTRGPCPGLNTAANHGYLPRSGIVTPLQLFVGTWQALSLSPDMCALLGALSFIFKGDPVHMTLSIGTDKDVYGQPMPNHLGTGIGEHGVLEGDASVTRQDHTLGNVWSLDQGLYNSFLDEIESTGNVNVMALSKGRYRAWKNTVDNNKQGDFNPWRMIVAYAESGFTHEALRGDNLIFTPQMVESWFYYERFPCGWQRRKIPVSIPEMVAWGALVWVASPLNGDPFPTPGWSIFGLWLPIPTLGSLGNFWKIFTTGGGQSAIGDLGCQAKSTFIDGILPGVIRKAFGSISLGGNTGFNC